MASVTAYRAASLLSRRAPKFTLSATANSIGAVASITASKRKLIHHNLERVLKRPLPKAEARRRGAKTYAYYARYYTESFRLPSLPTTEIDNGFSQEGFAPIAKAVEGGQGPILALPHLGTWEWAAWWLALVPKFKVTAVVEPLEPKKLYDWFVGFRESLGMEIVPLGHAAARRSLKALKNGNVLCLLADRDITGTGIPVDFFGERTTLPAGPAMLALKTGSPLIPTAVYWQNKSRHAICMPPLDTERRDDLNIDVARVTQELAQAFEHLISKAPEQWHMLSANWPSDYGLLGKPLPDHLKDLSPTREVVATQTAQTTQTSQASQPTQANQINQCESA